MLWDGIGMDTRWIWNMKTHHEADVNHDNLVKETEIRYEKKLESEKLKIDMATKVYENLKKTDEEKTARIKALETRVEADNK